MKKDIFSRGVKGLKEPNLHKKTGHKYVVKNTNVIDF